MAAGPPLSEHALAVLDGAACGLMQTTDDGLFLRANRVFCNWLGLESTDLVGKRRLQDLLTMGGKIFHQTHWAPLLRMQGSLSEVKLELVHRDGTTIPMVLNAIRREENGVLVNEVAAFVARDRDRYEQELVMARTRMESLVAETKQLHALANDRALFAEQMIGIVSHDLRNPLSTISMASDLLHSDPEAHARYAGQISRAVDRANHLIADLLDFTQARVGAGLSVSIRPADVHEAVAEILDGQRVAYPNRNFAHLRQGDGQCHLDVNRLAQLIGNLVANAVAYGSPDSPVRVTSSAGEASCTVSVNNAGDPIAPELLSTIFQPMTRGSTGSSKARSVGLGLFIVQEIARAHGGTASVRSTPDEGTTFTVVFPR